MRAILCVEWAAPGAAPGAPIGQWLNRSDQSIAPGAGGGGADHLLYADLSSCATWDTASRAAQEWLTGLRVQVRVPGAIGGVGLAAGPFAARCAAFLAPPGRLTILAPGSEAAALAPLPLSLLPGLSRQTQRRLATLLIHTLGDLAALPLPLLQVVFGGRLLELQALAQGREPAIECGSARVPAPPHVWRAVPGGRVEPATLDDLLAAMAGALGQQVAAVGQAISRLTVMVGFLGGASFAKTVALTPPGVEAADLLRAARPLLATLLGAHRRRPLWLRLEAAGRVAACSQLRLPLPPARLPDARRVPLEAAIVQIQARFGPAAIRWGPGPGAPLRRPVAGALTAAPADPVGAALRPGLAVLAP